MSRGQSADSPPEGFVLSTDRGPFTTRNGPFWHRPNAEFAEQAFFAETKHCNGMGLVHGGMLSAFLDGLLAHAVGAKTGMAMVTIHLGVDFVGMGRAGNWVLGEGRVTRATDTIAFAEGRAHSAGRDLARASAVFKLMRRTARTG